MSSSSSRSSASLTGRIALVTGASGGIGEAIAVHLAAAGASVALAGRRRDQLERVQQRIVNETSSSSIVVVTDVTKRQQVVDAAKQTETELGPIDILVNNAGVMYFTKMANLHVDEWERTIDVNCKGVLNGIGAVLQGMLDRGRGHIVNISSDAGRRVFPNLAVYCGSKSFVESMSEGLRRELVGTGLKVTTIQPGDVATDLIMNNTDAAAAAEMGVTIGAKVGSGAKSTEVLRPDDVASAVLYAVTAPQHVAINEVLVEPRDQA